MRNFVPIFLLFIISPHCNSTPKTNHSFKGKTEWTPEGTWYLTDVGTGTRLRKTPVFIFGKNNEFLDISQSVCRMEKIDSGELQISPDSPAPFIEFEEPPKLRNCPRYLYAWDTDGIVILHSDQSLTRPKINLGFAPSEAWQVNLFVNREYRLIVWIGGKKVKRDGRYNEMSFPILKGESN